jgi:hypothetical protein
MLVPTDWQMGAESQRVIEFAQGEQRFELGQGGRGHKELSLNFRLSYFTCLSRIKREKWPQKAPLA